MADLGAADRRRPRMREEAEREEVAQRAERRCVLRRSIAALRASNRQGVAI
jgi:hypothetical protein